ncbi:chondroitin-sulfate-ABC endolyase/exolyase [Cetobacterium ceti]|uniref:Chondroitin-sulfate-ABC endolyase/exolyase n=1 Tax=Cetobacterium ceti TaxID=180163 RepID=A0A1T4PGY8_9FUSO|nr:chondroitinase family polysaccharide lyase [Cetobacterium ceti]SJZ90048.1 chondroitin-sulfate-ABC endolyase/exolyase [Cetobacterium ceti]
MLKKLWGTMFLLSSIYSYGTTIYQFENGIPKNIKSINTSRLKITNEKYKDGNHSLKWNFNKNDSISILGDVGYSTFKDGGKEKARSSYSMWIYNKKPIDDKLIVQFKKNGIVKTSFPINMNFTGWRTMWVQYDRDMTGTPEEGMDEITFIAPNTSGEILIDQVIPSVLIDPRHNARDEQVPFVNLPADDAVNAHWMALYKNYNLIKYHKDNKPLTEKEIVSIKSIEDKFFNEIIKKVSVNKDIIEKKKEQLKEYKKINLEFIKRLVIYKNITSEERENIKYVPTKEFGIFLRELGYMYHSTNNIKEKNEIYSIFQNALNYMYDQGWTKGSSQGTIHHLGYQFREIYQGVFLMKTPLLKNNNLEKAREMVTWYSAMGIIYTDPNSMRGINIDILNTMLPGMLTAILLNDNINKEAQELTQFNKYLTKAITYSPGVIGGFKKDGSVFHHMQNYPAYGKGAFEGLTPIIYYLGGTPYGIKGVAYNIVKNSLLMSRIYSNKFNYLLTLTGRHPNNKFKIDDSGFKYTALGGENGVDKELAEAYLRLTPNGKDANKFKNLGFSPEKAPNGSWTMNMGSLQLHRRGEWLAGVKGYSRYLVGNETYIKNNLFGRYMSYGTFQILQDSLEQSGFVQEGWNWSHYPGTTAINLPLDKLKSNISQVDIYSGVEEMLLSDETYSGGNSLNGNGMFAMKLHEHPKYNGSHRARKSVFFFDNRAILLGSNIENNDAIHETHTTLFQNYLGQNNIIKENKIYKENTLLLDSQNNLYKIKNNEVVYSKDLQHSLDQNTGKPTKNNFELAYINHGKSPKNGTYEYAILIKGDKKSQRNFEKNSNYKVLNQDYSSHIVEDNISKMRGYAFFEKSSLQNDKFIKTIDTPSLILLSPEKDTLDISFVDPDLRLYEGIDKSQYDKNGLMKEVSIYSRNWKGNDGLPHTSTLTLKGKYKLKIGKNVKLKTDKNNTILEITSTYGTPVKIKLIKTK